MYNLETEHGGARRDYYSPPPPVAGVGQWWTGLQSVFQNLATGYGQKQTANAEAALARAEATRARADLARQQSTYRTLQKSSGWPAWAVAGVGIAAVGLVLTLWRRRRSR